MKRLACLAGAIILLGSYFSLKMYSLEIVHLIVLNAVIQKAPEAYSEMTIRETFSRCLEKADQRQSRDSYMQDLLRISQRLEKVQFLNDREIDKLLENLDCK